jgi:uncharacterized protein (DUF697 family)
MDTRDAAANTIVERHVWYAVGAGMVPIPLLDAAAMAAINLWMVKELSAVYEVDYSEDRVKAVVGALTGGAAAGLLGRSTIANTVLKSIPFLGQTVAALSMSVFGGATTYAVGKVFIQHYAAGGTLLDFDPEKARAFFADQYEKGKRLVTRKRAEPVPSPA